MPEKTPLQLALEIDRLERRVAALEHQLKIIAGNAERRVEALERFVAKDLPTLFCINRPNPYRG